MQLTKPQQQIANDTNRFRIVVAGRRFGKTFLSIREMCYFARVPNKIIYAIFPTYRMAKTIVWEELKDRLTKLRWVKRINETELTIRLVNGSKIVLAGADTPDRLRGISCDFVVFDEYASIDPNIWTVIRPTLADRGGNALWISSPNGKNHMYDMYQWAQAQEDWSTYKFTTLDGGQVPAQEIEAARQEMDERSFKQEFLADWVDYVGLVYYSFSELCVQKLDMEKLDTIYVGIDFNVDPGCAVVGAMTAKNSLHIFDEIELRNTNTFEMAEEIKRRYPNKVVKIFPDPAGAQRRTSSTTTDHKILHNAGFNVYVRRAHPPVKDRINSVNSAFSNGKLLIDPACKSLRNCLNKLSYREGTNEPDKNSGFDHMTDALGYMVEYCMPITKVTTPRVEPARWAINAPAVRRFG
tara:strand:- start:1528 stop:2757 length:1230 start_codon:yes stop_codon:yes gene_type:complete